MLQRHAIAALVLASLLHLPGICVGNGTAPAILPVETFFRPLAYTDIVLSPSGRYLAVLYPSHDTINVGTIDLATKQVQGLTGFPNATLRVTWVRWKSEDRLLFGVDSDEHGVHTESILAVNRDGTSEATITTSGTTIVSWLPQDPNHILVSARWDVGHASERDLNAVFRLFTGDIHDAASRALGRETAVVVKPPGRECQFVVDNNGDPRVCTTHETDGTARIMFRDTPTSGWRLLRTVSNANMPDFKVAGFTLDNTKLYVFSEEERDTKALFEFDPTNATRGRLVYEAPGVDVFGVSFAADHSLLAATYAREYFERQYLNPQAAQLQRELSEAFPGETVTLASTSDDWKRAVVRVASGRSPGRFYLYDEKKQTVEQLVAEAPWIDEKLMAEVRPIRIKTRDGVELNGYLTVPPGRPPTSLPIIVVPHGGPVGIRDLPGWRPDTQFFANRGYAVIQVNFRGSGGYGRTFTNSGIGEFAEGMLDDVEDTLRWAVDGGIADPKRACIYGISYGGYAALMSLIRNPTQYRCAVSISGLTDLHTALSRRYDTASFYRDRPRYEIDFWKRLIGTHEEDPNFMKAHSPVFNADKIAAPVFIAHGALDLTVPISDATRMRDALKANGKTVEYLARDDESQGFSHENNRIELFSQIGDFLRKYDPAE
jgi:dipeptidyl aminopeptidase/acylaminoacyl peptidase